MELILSRDPLLKILNRIQSVVEKRNTMPILAYALMVADGDTLTLSATDTELSVRAVCDAQVEEEGILSVPARKLYDVVRELPDLPVRMKSETGDRMLVTCGRARFTLLCLPGEEFPKIPQPDEGPHIPVSSQLVARLMDKVHFAMSTDETRFTLNGAYLRVEPFEDRHVLRMVATDTHRLSVAQYEIMSESPYLDQPRDVIIPRKAVGEIHKVLKEEDDQVELILGENFIQIIKPRFTMISKLVAGRYPNYKRAIPEGNNHLLTIQKAGFLSLLRRMVVISSEKSHSIQFQVMQDSIQVNSNNPEQEAGEEELEVVYSGPPVTIGFSARYLLEILGAVEGDAVRFSLGGAGGSCPGHRSRQRKLHVRADAHAIIHVLSGNHPTARFSQYC
ncbi:MAG: DNA polymerase III subunit beta [Magnetococcales bacterium]|nr:DNA polymerase III subunit beta [Magnetococcales bacterium]